MSLSLAAAVSAIASTELLKKVFSPVAEKIGNELKGLAQEKWTKYTNSFDRYLKEIEHRHKYFRSQIFANEGQLLENFYIPLTLQKVSSSSRQTSTLINSYPVDLIAAYKDFLVIDTAGMGKSTLLKFIFIKSLREGTAIPIFIELRKLSKERTLMSFISEELRFSAGSSSEKLLDACLVEGIFTFFLDGFDEIADEDKAEVSRQIVALKNRANDNRFILSSREEESLAYLCEFHRFSIKPLSQEEAFNLIRKISPEPQISASLIAKVQAQPQNSLKEFLTNPLLVSLLVKSFLHSPILPVRLSEFYRQVYDALFQNHDAKKELGGFTRKKKSGLDLDRFHKVLRALGVLTYKANKLEFSVDELSAQIESAKVLTAEGGFSTSSFQHDLLHAVPIFVQEGLSVRWAHRSLQEYFAASYLCIDSKEKQSELFIQLYTAGVQKNANILRLCADIDSKTFRNVLVRKYLVDRLAGVTREFSEENFPFVKKNSIGVRRSILMDADPIIVVLPRALGYEAAQRKMIDYFPINMQKLGAAMLNSSGGVATQNDKVKYFMQITLNSFRSMDSIIYRYFNQDITVEKSQEKVRGTYRDFPHSALVVLDNARDSPANAPGNFEITTALLSNIARLLGNIYDIEGMGLLLKTINQNERRSSGLEISFE